MPLQDHFRPPAEDYAPWGSVGTFWVVSLSKWLNRTLPMNRYRAITSAHLGRDAEADIAEYERPGVWGPDTERNGTGGVATMTIPAATGTFEATFPDEFSVQIREVRRGMNLVAAIEFVSPGNKDCDERRSRFVSKCLTYLDKGIGVVVVDIVTSRHANLHNGLIAAVRGPDSLRMADVPTYVAGYRASEGTGQRVIDAWTYPAAVGSPIPAVPLALKNGPILMLDLEATYLETLADHPE